MMRPGIQGVLAARGTLRTEIRLTLLAQFFQQQIREFSPLGLEVDQVRQLNQLQEENPRLKQLVADLTLD